MVKNTEMVSEVTITPPKFTTAIFKIVGTAPYVQCKFSEKIKNQIISKHELGHAGKKGTKKEPRDFNQQGEDAKHQTEDGKCGIPASAFRNALISACRLVGFKMTLAKLSIFIEPDGFDKDDATPLVFINGDVKIITLPVRNETGVIDIRSRPIWRKWDADVRVRWDSDMFSAQDISNLLSRVGSQVGLGEGRPDSKKSAGIGWGLFKVESEE